MKDHAVLFATLRSSRRGLHRYDAATEYLIRVHEETLTKPFDAEAVCSATRLKMMSAWVDWDELSVNLTGAWKIPRPEDHRVLQVASLAVELAGEMATLTLHDILSGQDRDHTRLALEAIAAHQGIHESRPQPGQEPRPLLISGNFNPEKDS